MKKNVAIDRMACGSSGWLLLRAAFGLMAKVGGCKATAYWGLPRHELLRAHLEHVKVKGGNAAQHQQEALLDVERFEDIDHVRQHGIVVV